MADRIGSGWGKRMKWATRAIVFCRVQVGAAARRQLPRAVEDLS